MNGALRRDILPAADFPQGAEHRLEFGEPRFDFIVLPARVHFRPRGGHNGRANRLRLAQTTLRRDLAQQLPDLFRDERNDRMQKPQQRIERMGQNTLGDDAPVFVRQTVLQHFDEEAAELVPSEVVQDAGGIGIVVRVQRIGDLPGDRCQPAENPAVFHGQFAIVDGAGRVAVQVDQREARGVP